MKNITDIKTERQNREVHVFMTKEYILFLNIFLNLRLMQFRSFLTL